MSSRMRLIRSILVVTAPLGALAALVALLSALVSAFPS
jgi:hypothetical protein